MPLANITQPDFININENLRLKKYDGVNHFALAWYKDENDLLLINGNTEPYDIQKLNKMYDYLDKNSELYFIEYKTLSKFEAIGDVAFSMNDMPITIGDKNLRGLGIGKLVINALISRANHIGYKELFISEIYSYNIGSKKLFESVGFTKYKKTAKGSSYHLNLA